MMSDAVRARGFLLALGHKNRGDTMSKRKVAWLIASAVILPVLYFGSLFGDLRFSPLAFDSIPAHSRSLIESKIGDAFDEADRIDRMETNHIIVELYAVRRKDGRETRYVTEYQESLFLNKYRASYHREIESIPYSTTIRGFPKNCTFIIDRRGISLDESQWGWDSQLIGIVCSMIILIRHTIWVIVSIAKDKKEKKKESD